MLFTKTSEQPKSRKYKRTPAPEVGLVDVFKFASAGGKRRIGPSLLEDMSENGFAIRMDFPVPVGTVLYLTNRFITYTATVRHCAPVEVGYRLGLEFRSKGTASQPASTSAEA
jgi:hypothetical protein